MKASKYLTIRITEADYDRLRQEKKRRIRNAVRRNAETDGITLTSIVLEGIRKITEGATAE